MTTSAHRRRLLGPLGPVGPGLLSGVLALVAVLAAPDTAFADRRTNGLAGDVADRPPPPLGKKRVEFAPPFQSTINADFRHTPRRGAQLQYHLRDMFSIR